MYWYGIVNESFIYKFYRNLCYVFCSCGEGVVKSRILLLWDKLWGCYFSFFKIWWGDIVYFLEGV